MPQRQLTLSDRIKIESGLYAKRSLKQIAASMNRSISTISREIQNNRTEIAGDRPRGKDCAVAGNCAERHLCGDAECTRKCVLCRDLDCVKLCSHPMPLNCKKISKPPYVCNTCPDRRKCRKNRAYYIAQQADEMSKRRRSDSRKGIQLDAEELQRLDDLVTPLIKKGQPLTHIWASHKDDIQLSQRTLYPNDIALMYFGKKITYAQLFAEVENTAKAFAAQGVKSGDNVALCVPATPETMYAILALNKLGANANMLNPTFTAQQLTDRINETDAALMIVANELYGVIFVDRKDKEDMAASKHAMSAYLNKGRSIVMFPEGTWNLTENQLMLPMKWGIIDIAKETGAQIVPTVLEYDREQKKCFVRFGTPMIFSPEDSKAEAIVALRDTMASMRWKFWERKGTFRRADFDVEAERKKLFYSVAEYPPIDWEYESSCIYHPYTISEDAFSHLNQLISCRENAFLFRNR